MELTYRGRAESLVNFFNSVFGSNIAKHVFLGRQINSWPVSGISVFKPEGMDYQEGTGDLAKSAAYLGVNVELVDSAIVTADNTSVAEPISYNGSTYYRTKAKGSPINEDATKYTIAGVNKNTFLLYIKINLKKSSDNAITFRKIGFADGDNPDASKVICYENIPDQSLVVGSETGVSMSLILAF